MPDSDVDLATAAEMLGVHYQTAYRWVRSGALPAMLVRGRYRVGSEEVEAMARRRDRPVRPRALRPRGGYGGRRNQMFEHLLAGDDADARKMIAQLLDEGVGLTEATQEVLVPALWRIGEEWHEGRIGIWTEHRASATVERILGEHHPAPRGRRRGTAVVAALAGDRHSLPTLMAAIALREDNWRVQHLGADVPADELVDFCEREGADLAAITVTGSGGGRARRVAGALRERGIRAIVGEPGASLERLQREARGS